MGMPRPQFRLDSNLKRRFLNAFVKLEEVRMSFADADPNDLDHSFRRKCSDALHRKKKRTKIDCFEFFAQSKIDILLDVGKKTEGEVDLIARRPTHAANVRIKIDQDFSN